MEIAQASRGSGTESESLKIRVTELKLFVHPCQTHKLMLANKWKREPIRK